MFPEHVLEVRQNDVLPLSFHFLTVLRKVLSDNQSKLALFLLPVLLIGVDDQVAVYPELQLLKDLEDDRLDHPC